MTPFDVSKNIMKKETKLSSDVIASDGNPWMLNKIFSNDQTFCIFADAMNRNGLSNKMVYDFYYHGIPKTSKYIPYNSKKATQDKHVKYFMEFYRCNQNLAKQYLKLVSKEEKQEVIDFFEKRGKKK